MRKYSIHRQRRFHYLDWIENLGIDYSFRHFIFQSLTTTTLFIFSFVALDITGEAADLSVSSASINSLRTVERTDNPIFSITEEELRDLIQKLAPKVNLFQDIWSKDSQVEFFGGTSRDFIYWILKHFRNISERSQIDQIKNELIRLPFIDIRKILHFESDIDLMSHSTTEISDIKPENYGIRKIDTVDFQRFDADSEMGRTEIDQGSIPTEKIRIGTDGIVTDSQFGNGLAEILSGRLSINIPDPIKYRETHYVKAGLNHPVLLALRYIRNLAQDYLHRFGNDFPNLERQLELLDQKSVAWTKATIDAALSDDGFKALIANSRARRWLSGSINKAFRGYSNGTAAFQWFQFFHVDQLQRLFPNQIASLHDFLLIQNWDDETVRKNWIQFAGRYTERETLISPNTIFTDGYYYHGAGSSEAFRSLIFQGAIPSSTGSAGRGFYGVPLAHMNTAESFALKSGDGKRIVKARVSETARILDISKGNGLKLFEEWKKSTDENGESARVIDRFAEAFGIDIILYAYHPLAAVVKNRRALLRFEGVHYNLLTLDEIQEKALSVKSPRDLIDFFTLIQLNNLNESEIKRLFLSKENLTQKWKPFFNSREYWELVLNDSMLSKEMPRIFALINQSYRSHEADLITIMAIALDTTISLIIQQKKINSKLMADSLEPTITEVLTWISEHGEWLSESKEFYSSIKDSLERLSDWCTKNGERLRFFIPVEFFYYFSVLPQFYYPKLAKNFSINLRHYVKLHSSNAIDPHFDTLSLRQLEARFILETFFSKETIENTLQEMGPWTFVDNMLWLPVDFWQQLSERLKNFDIKESRSLPNELESLKFEFGYLAMKFHCMQFGPKFHGSLSALNAIKLLVELSILSEQFPTSNKLSWDLFIERLSSMVKIRNPSRTWPKHEIETIAQWLSDPRIFNWVRTHRCLVCNSFESYAIALFQILGEEVFFELWKYLKSIPFFQRFYAQYVLENSSWAIRHWNDVLELARSHKADREIALQIARLNIDDIKKKTLREILNQRNDAFYQFLDKPLSAISDEFLVNWNSQKIEAPKDAPAQKPDREPTFNPEGTWKETLNYLKEMTYFGFNLDPEIRIFIATALKRYVFSEDFSFDELNSELMQIVNHAADLNATYDFLNSIPWRQYLIRPLSIFERSPLKKSMGAGLSHGPTAADLGIDIVEVRDRRNITQISPHRLGPPILVHETPPQILTDRFEPLQSEQNLKSKSHFYFKVDPRAIAGVDFFINSDETITWNTSWALGLGFDLSRQATETILRLSLEPRFSVIVLNLWTDSFGNAESVLNVVPVLENLIRHGNIDREIVLRLMKRRLNTYPELIERLVKNGNADYEIDMVFLESKQGVFPAIENALGGKKPTLHLLRQLFSTGFTFESSHSSSAAPGDCGKIIKFLPAVNP